MPPFLFDTSYEDYIDFENYIRDVLDDKYANVAAENKLLSDEKESFSWTIKLATLEKKKLMHYQRKTNILKDK